MEIGGSLSDLNSTAVAAVLVVVGLGIMGLGYLEYTTQQERLQNAVEVNATVLESDVRSTGGGDGLQYRPEIRFEYVYDGERYTGDDVFPSVLSPGSSSRSWASNIADDYAEGENVTAYADPDEPDAAFLINEGTRNPYLFTGLGFLFGVGGVVVAMRRPE